LEPNDTQPGDQPNRTITIQLSRDTLILIAALAFLVIAILLAVIFPGQTPGTSPGSTSVAAIATQRPTASGGTPEPTAGDAEGDYPVLQTPAVPTTAPFQPGDYPAPPEATGDTSSGDFELPTVFSSGNPEAQLTLTPGEGGSVQPESTDIPPFQPSRPSQPTPSDPGSFSAQTTYPAPEAAATPEANPEDDFEDEPDEVSPEPTDSLFQPEPTDPPTPRPTTRPQPRPTTAPAGGAGSSGVPTARPRPTPAPTIPPIDVLRGNVRWTADQSPIFVRRDLQIAAGATLIVEPGVEVQLAPGASIFVEGTLYALGKPDQPVQFVGSSGERWEAIYGRAGSNIGLEHTTVRGGGSGGTVLLSEGGNLVLRGARINENGGHVQVTDSRLEMRDSEIAGNDMPYGSALEASYSGGNLVTLSNNRIGGNRLQPGTSPVWITSQSPFDTLQLDIQRNLLIGMEGPDLTLSTNGPLAGGLTCNTLVGGSDGLSLRSETTQVPGFSLDVRDNAIEKHTPPIIPIYLEYGIGRGATSEVALDMRNNWWGHPLGPYEPERNVDGRGEAVGDNIEFGPWLAERPACAPSQ
jgi:hypothetical protein